MNITEELIPPGKINRPGTANSCKYITIHETANKKTRSNAWAHAEYIKTIKERMSWHYTVDDSSIYQHIPDNEKSYHTSDKYANENSIAIELCVNSDGNFEKTKENAVWLVRQLMAKYNIPTENILCHHDWTGKKCPANLLKKGWKEFVKQCGESEKFVSIDELKAMGYNGIKF